MKRSECLVLISDSVVDYYYCRVDTFGLPLKFKATGGFYNPFYNSDKGGVFLWNSSNDLYIYSGTGNNTSYNLITLSDLGLPADFNFKAGYYFNFSTGEKGVHLWDVNGQLYGWDFDTNQFVNMTSHKNKDSSNLSL